MWTFDLVSRSVIMYRFYGDMRWQRIKYWVLIFFLFFLMYTIVILKVSDSKLSLLVGITNANLGRFI